ncbi:MAG: YecA family protein [Myxococcota bacterium]
MARRDAKGRGRRGRGGEPAGREWVGGCLSPPFFVTDRDEPYRPGLVVWMDVRDGLVVGQEVVAPEKVAGAVGQVLLETLEHPLSGPPRRPDRIRVADAALAAEVREALGNDTPVAVAPTPELDQLLEAMLESMPQPGEGEGEDDDESYLEDGRISPGQVADLFRSAEVLYRIAPWKVATDDRVLRMDIPALGVEGACVSIIGNLDESLGLVIFPSLSGYEAFVRAGDERRPGARRLDWGTDWLALGFERGADLPAAMRREVAEYGWPVADAHGYPRVQRIERDGASRPLVERDLKIATACAASLTAFFAKHRGAFQVDDAEPICESWFDGRDLEVRFTLPYEAFALFDVQDAPSPAPAPRARTRVGRNDPCPCGSGRKYKKCHLAADRAERAAEHTVARARDLDAELCQELGAFAMVRFGIESRDFARDFVDPEQTLQLALPWSVYHYHVQGRSVLEWFLEERGRDLARPERAWLAAQQAAWLSVWEVIAVEPGQSVTLRDLLSHEERRVREVSASTTLVVRDALLGRVVDYEGLSLLCGVHPRPLPPVDAAEVVRRARGRLRRKRAVPVERLRDERFGRYLIRRWEEAVAELDLRAAVPPQLHNTDGDPLLFTTDHFELDPAVRDQVEARLAAMEGVEPGDAEGGPEDAIYIFIAPGNRMHGSWDNTLMGRARLEGTRLQLETNSRERADALRARVETACEGLLCHRAREHSDPFSPPVQAAMRDASPEPPPPEAEQLILDFKRRHYLEWLDQPLPALDGLSPREAVSTARGREAVDVLLKDMENREQRSPDRSAFDFSEVRRELRLEGR